MRQLERVLKEDAKADFWHTTEEQINKHGFEPVLKGFMFALDKADPEQKKVLDALTRIAIY
jgi:hypothetical protein